MQEREADKFFLVVLIRFFDPKHAIFGKNYQPPQKPSKAQGVNSNVSEAMLSEYHSALEGIPSLKGGNARKKRGGGIVQAFDKPNKRISTTQKLKADLIEKQVEIDALLAQKIQSAEQTDPAAGINDHIQYDVQQHPNVIGNLHEVAVEEQSLPIANKENI